MLGDQIPGLTECRRCPRLVRYLAALPPKRGYSPSDYWGRPVPGFGDLQAAILLVGLAPGAHGANRTGRPFTGDGAGNFMYPLLHRAGLASRGEALHAGDGLTLRDLYIGNAIRCAPPDNKPAPEEFAACRPYLAEEMASLPRLKVIVALGQGAFTSILRHLHAAGEIDRISRYPFAHGAEYRLPGGLWLVACYHTSRYNVQTGRMTGELFTELLGRVQRLAGGEND